jgi:hypothetical protein
MTCLVKPWSGTRSCSALPAAGIPTPAPTSCGTAGLEDGNALSSSCGFSPLPDVEGPHADVKLINHVIRSRRQRPATTCNLSMDGADPWVWVRGCPWSSVAVDVGTDVDREALRSRARTGGLPAAKHLIMGQVFHAQASQRAATHRSCTLGLVWHPVGLVQPDHAAAQGRPSTEPVHASCGSAPGLPCGSPWEAGGMPHPPAQAQPQRFLCPAIPEACPPGEGMVL